MLMRIVIFLLALTAIVVAQSPNTQTFSSYVQTLPPATTVGSSDLLYIIQQSSPRNATQALVSGTFNNTTSSINCGSLGGSAGCIVVTVNGTTHYVPYY